ncbi:tRNA glutamyl-Q(34) synthetase GluQRS [Actinomyces vulturis]|uniref:tRNA glutamyl-Q(34) synthetase GluQRS n=1 Tax=Actinomyces vulturis TaxID=1857645 RepID=UPI0009F2C442|nr:tRNA glutamyl-Q(34) synthetase GluQRS [Actinomyces vulturis]
MVASENLAGGEPARQEQKTHKAGRFAPSPTGDLHLGNLRTAILAEAWARATGRRFLLRVEDLDRVRSGSTERQLEQLTALGITWDEEPLIQSTRGQAHDDVLKRLMDGGYLFECYCSRKDIREASSAPHAIPGHYPGTCLHLSDDEREERRVFLASQGRVPALRLNAPAASWQVHDELHGDFEGPVDHVVLRRNDGAIAYNLAVVVDDAFQGVDQVVRGDDLLMQSPAQSCLASLLGYAEPVYVHVPLAINANGARLAKRDGAVTLPDLEDLGYGTTDVVRWISNSLGVLSGPPPENTKDLLALLDEKTLRAMPTKPWIIEAIHR